MTAHLPVDGPDHKQVESEYELPLETAWSEEHERVPLKQRLKILRAKAVSESREEIFISAIPPIDDAVNKEDDLCDSLGFHSDHDSEARSSNESCEECQHGTESSSLQDRMLSKRLEVEHSDAQDDSVTQLPNCQLLPSSVDDIEISEDFLEDLDHVVLKERQRMLLSRELVRSIGTTMEYNLSDPSANLDDMFLQNGGIGSGGSDNCGIRSAIGGSDVFEKCDGNVYAFCEASESGPLNGITVGASAWTYQHHGTTITESQNYKNVCGEAKSSSSSRSVINEKCLLSSSCKTVRTLALPPFPNVKVESLDDELQIPNKDALDNPCLGNQISVKNELLNSAENSEDIIDHMLLGDRMRLLESGSLNGITVGAPAWTYQHQGTTLTESRNYKNICGEARPCSSGRSAINENYLLSSSCKPVCTSVLPPFPNVKVEPLDDELQIPTKNALDNPCLGSQISVKSEFLNSAENFEDIIDHILLGDRMRLLESRKFPKTIFYENFENSRTFVPSDHDHRPTLSESLKPLMMKRSRKRRKTVTDSVETALEEDAPGLLQVLIEKGVLVDEIKLYGETEGDEALDESLIEESFSELEDVITKIFSQRQSLFKFAPIRCAKGEKASYCLACLISLVEQARYLRARKWPVEWGWCRDLQSFIFVFERHNRIVLERPEYGYATYFFELVDALPVHWQIKRLVTTMKLTSCSRITLIENRALMVGDDLTEGEARLLMEYGWIPDSGLGTMLNYRDRVVHDRKHESDSSEWRSKIGKLLTDGYNGGTIVPNDIPKKVKEYMVLVTALKSSWSSS